jgi:DNA polymerase III beta subunit
MVIEKYELAQKISKLKGVVPKRTTIPALQGILVKDGYLIANNLEMSVKAKIEGAGGETFIIQMKAFDLISNLPDGPVEVTLEKENSILIKAGKIRNRYQTMDPENFPLNDAPDGEGEEITIKSELLLESVKRVSYAIPAQSSNQLMTALCVQAEDGFLNFVGLDGHVLAWDRVDYQGDFSLLIPKATAEKISSIGISGDVAIRHSKSNAIFITKDYEIYTRLIDGEYFKYKNMFNDLPLHTVIARNEFLNAMIRAKMCTDEQSPARFEISGSTMNISIRDYTTDYHETITLQEELEQDLTIGFNARLVIETLKAFDCENVGIQLSNAKMPMIVEAEDSDFRAIVLPVAIKQ